MRIAICPGHYSVKPGAENKKYKLSEHIEARHVVYALQDILYTQHDFVSIFFGSLPTKVSHINNGQYDLALDIHFNTGGGHGCEVLYYPPSLKREKQAASMSAVIAKELEITDRGAKEGYYRGSKHYDYFVAKTNCMAFIVEPLFLDNDAEVEKFLLSGKHGDIAESIALSIRTLL